jgi:WD40 repeat protein
MTDIDTLLAKQAITEVLYTYCRAMDRIDEELTLSIWHPDGTCNYTGDAGKGDILFRDYLPGSAKARRSFANHSHQITNILIQPKGDLALSEAYFTASLQTKSEDGRVLEHVWRGRYLDRWSRREGNWAIDHRQVVFDSYTPYEFDADSLSGLPLLSSRRDKDDPSYRHFGDR